MINQDLEKQVAEILGKLSENAPEAWRAIVDERINLGVFWVSCAVFWVIAMVLCVFLGRLAAKHLSEEDDFAPAIIGVSLLFLISFVGFVLNASDGVTAIIAPITSILGQVK